MRHPSHQLLLAQIEKLRQAIEATPEDVELAWCSTDKDKAKICVNACKWNDERRLFSGEIKLDNSFYNAPTSIADVFYSAYESDFRDTVSNGVKRVAIEPIVELDQYPDTLVVPVESV